MYKDVCKFHYFLKSFGCQMNSADSDFIAGLLTARGFAESKDAETADVLLVNTCCVREKAENRALAQIREYCAIKKKDSLLWVVGCAAQRAGEELKKKIPNIQRVIGAQEIEFIEEKIDEYLLPLGHFEVLPQKIKSKWSAFLPVMRGCNNFCTYCIVPFVRGREHCVKSAQICEQAQEIVAGGASEITLLGQNVNSYRDDNLDFADLLVKVSQTQGLKRLRFMTSHPKDISEKLVETIAKTPNLCKHIHLPVQSGSSAVLEKMNRKYTREQYLEKIAMIRKIIPDCDITTDAMVGFPDETQKQFDETVSLFEQVKFSFAFMFAYSQRDGTAAAACKERVQISQEEKLRRLAKLVEVQNSITKDFYSSMISKEFEVFFTLEQNKKNAHSWVGQDFGAKRILVDTQQDLGGKIAKVKIINSSGMTLVGELV